MPELTIKDAFISWPPYTTRRGRAACPRSESISTGRSSARHRSMPGQRCASLGVIAHQVGRNDVAVDFIRRAIAVDPGMPTPHTNLGLAARCMELGQFDQAIAAHRHAIALRP